MANAETEFAEYLSMESFFNAETMSQQTFGAHPGAHPPQQNGDYFAPLEPANYNYETGIADQEKFEFHNNNNNVQYFYENNNSVQVQQPPTAVAQHPEFYVSCNFCRLL